MVLNAEKVLNILLEQEFYQKIRYGRTKLRAKFSLSLTRIVVRFGDVPPSWITLAEEYFLNQQRLTDRVLIGYSRAIRALNDRNLQKAADHLKELEASLQFFRNTAVCLRQYDEIAKVRRHITYCLDLLSRSP